MKYGKFLFAALSYSTLLPLIGAGCRASSGGPVSSRLDQHNSVYLLPIPDAQNTDDNTHVGSGETATARTRAMLLRLGAPLADEESSANYVLTVRFTDWEDHATQWNGELDVVAMSFELVDTKTKAVVAHSESSAKGSWFTFVNERPNRLIRTAVADGVCRLYAVH